MRATQVCSGPAKRAGCGSPSSTDAFCRAPPRTSGAPPGAAACRAGPAAGLAVGQPRPGGRVVGRPTDNCSRRPTVTEVVFKISFCSRSVSVLGCSRCLLHLRFMQVWRWRRRTRSWRSIARQVPQKPRQGLLQDSEARVGGMAKGFSLKTAIGPWGACRVGVVRRGYHEACYGSQGNLNPSRCLGRLELHAQVAEHRPILEQHARHPQSKASRVRYRSFLQDACRAETILCVHLRPAVSGQHQVHR